MGNDIRDSTGTNEEHSSCVFAYVRACVRVSVCDIYYSKYSVFHVIVLQE